MARKSSDQGDRASNTDEKSTTQRAYTLRLQRSPRTCPACGKNECDCWREALWATHEAVNRGAKAFGDWLLTLRGGLCHTLADHGKPDEAERRNRRILLALSWLTVEDQRGAPQDYRVTSAADCSSERRAKLEAALRAILKKRGLGATEIESWIKDCSDSLAAEIRSDAVWVNRSAMFDAMIAQLPGLEQQYAQMTTMTFFGPAPAYFALPDTEGAGMESEEGQAEEGPEFKTLARQWLSTNFGTGQKSDTTRISHALRTLGTADLSRYENRSREELIGAMADRIGDPTGTAQLKDSFERLRTGIGWATGRASKGRLAIEGLPAVLTRASIEAMQRKLREEAEEKEKAAGLREVPAWMPNLQKQIEKRCEMPFIGNRNHIGEFSVMLDHAARRVSIAHSWIKRAEARRRTLEQDAALLHNVPAEAVAWLDQYCADRSEETGAAAAGGAYRIRRRAIDGWEEVVKRWTRGDCRTADDRIAAAREVQDDPEIEKFGDIQLFEALAADDALCVWRPAGRPDPSILRDYVLGHDARFRRQRFKVPAYRHPDPLRHPVFCEFGKSRWDIGFSVHDRYKACRDGKKRKREDAANGDLRDLQAGLWTGRSLEMVPMRWASKRLAADLGLNAIDVPEAAAVPRADRAGRAAAGAAGPAIPRHAFDEEEWNGRLQAPRHALERIADLLEKNHPARAEELKRRIPWLLTFSPRLCPAGPFIEYAARLGLRPNKKSGQYFPNSDLNKADRREGLARLILSRLPGLRVLSVDLGHRFAAACAVWEAMPSQDFQAEVGRRTMVAGGTGPEHMYCHTDHVDDRGRRRKTIYRRIGSDTLPDGTPHPAPWARLDRQFLIRLQGEETPARAASAAELDFVKALEARIGRTPMEIDTLPRRVDELMARAVRSMRLGLKRHGLRARIARALDPATRTIPGMGGSEKSFTPGDEDHVRLLVDALTGWYTLATERSWTDPMAGELWNRYIRPLAGAWAVEELNARAENIEERTATQRKREMEALRQRLEPLARQLARLDTTEMHAAWQKYWRQEDGCPADNETGRVATGWYRDLRKVTDWITGRRYPGESSVSKGWRWHLGGLSLQRIATMRSLYQLHKAFSMRPAPDNLRGAPLKGETGDKIAKSLLEAMERMREQRVKQLASRIIEAALGIGRVKRFEGGKDPKRPCERVDEPCHAVVIEDLTHYRPEETRTRRENRQLMSWSSSKVKKYLAEACQLNGLHLREVQAGYTSRQDSRTGAPGIRCQDVPVKEFMQSPFWRKQVAQAEKKQAEGKGDARERFLCDLNANWKPKPEADWEKAGSVRVPLKGGEIFVSANAESPAAKGLQADLNAAANIGLKALLDPDWPGRWWYVPCDPTTFKPAKDKVAGSAAICLDKPLRNAPAAQDAQGTKKKQGKAGARSREVVNLWRDVSSRPISGNDGWREFTPYWNDVQARVVNILRQSAGLSWDQRER